MCVFGAFLLAPATRLQQSWLEEREGNGRNGGMGSSSSSSSSSPSSRAEDEMRSLVSSAMEGVGHKRPEGRKRHSSNAGVCGDRRSIEVTDASESAAATVSGSSNGNGGVQQFGNMQVIT